MRLTQDLKDDIFNFLITKYIQRADSRQARMGLQYTEAETYNLASELARWLTHNYIIETYPTEEEIEKQYLDTLRS